MLLGCITKASNKLVSTIESTAHPETAKMHFNSPSPVRMQADEAAPPYTVQWLIARLIYTPHIPASSLPDYTS